MFETSSFAPRAVDGLTRTTWIPQRPFSSQDSAATAVRRSALFFFMSAYVFFLPVQFENATLNLAPSDLMLALALVFGLGRLRLVPRVWSAAHAALMAVFLLGACVSISEYGILLTFVKIKVAGLAALFAGYLCLTSAAPDWAEVRTLLRIFVYATALHVVLAIAAFYGGWSVLGMNSGTVGVGFTNVRLSGMLIDPNAFGGLVMVALVLQLVTLESGQPLIKGIFGWAIAATLTVGLALTLSRSAWIGFGFALTVAALYRWRLAAIWAVFAAAAAVAVWMTVVNPDPSLKGVERTNTAMERVSQIEQAIPIFSSGPILGAGLGGYAERVNDLVTGGTHILHNTTVWIMTDLGLVGLSAYLAFLAWFFLQGAAAGKVASAEPKALILALMCAHAGMIGVSTGIEAFYQRHWWFVMALLASCCALVRNEAAHRTPAGAR